MKKRVQPLVEEMKEKLSISQRQRYKEMTPEERMALRLKQAEAMRRYWQGMSMAERAKRLLKNKPRGRGFEGDTPSKQPRTGKRRR